MAEVRFTVRQAISAKWRDLPEEPLKELTELMRVGNPKYVNAVRMGKPTGSLPPKLHGYEMNSETIHIKRGARKTVVRIFEKHGHSVVFDDQRTQGQKLQDYYPNLTLRDYQFEAVEYACQQQQCIIQGPCGSGKTRIGAGIILGINQKTIILVHTKDLAQQWLEGLREVLEIPPGLIGDGEFEPREVTVVISPYFTNKRGKHFDKRHEVVKDVGLLIVDECHLAHYEIADRIPAAFRIGLTATPVRGDGTTRMMLWSFGDVYKATNHRELVKQGVRVVPDFEQIQTDFYADYREPSDWPDLLKALVADEARVRLIADSIASKKGRHILVLGGQIAYCSKIYNELKKLGVDSYVLTGEVGSAERKEALEKTRKGEIKILIATSLGDVGLDVPLLDCLFLVFPSRSTALTHQRIGRVLRLHPEKGKPLIVDFVDSKVGVLANQSREREAVFATYKL